MIRVKATMIGLTALCAIVISGCGGAGLIPAGDSSALDQSLGQVAQATAAGDCEAAGSALANAQNQFRSLPSSVNSELRSTLESGLQRLATTVPKQCQGTVPKPITTPTTTTSAPTTTTTTPTTTTTTPTTTTTTTAPINITRTCTVNNIPGVVGSSTVANVNATDVPSSQTALASCDAASALVKGVARTQAEQPVTVQGSQCTPSVSGSTAKWTCVEHGADSALTITTKFPLTYTN